ncbi:hypothetical protein ALC56_07503 [Trachymyrmex septentrionalis]|uniref:Uncharacterized protein n=1 Tax=Trachymyrmex septentrionalis TaxID=34720 RepID=A0A195FCG6_9HYME|nr:hypothetical protein ALC56_07503 [Trachymyrmex septentrionalis]
MVRTASASVLVIAAVLSARFEMLCCLERFPMHPYRSTMFSILPNNHGATDSFSLALLKIVSGSGKECRTIAPYKPYSAIMSVASLIDDTPTGSTAHGRLNTNSFLIIPGVPIKGELCVNDMEYHADRIIMINNRAFANNVIKCRKASEQKVSTTGCFQCNFIFLNLCCIFCFLAPDKVTLAHVDLNITREPSNTD